MKAFDAPLHCLAELQEIEREDQGSAGEGKKRWRTRAAQQHVRVFWDMAHGNELALHDLRELTLKKCEDTHCREARAIV